MMGNMNIQKNKIVYIWLAIGAILILLPLIWMLLTSFKTLNETLLSPPTIFPENFTFENYKEVVTELPFIRLVLNTVIVLLGVIVGTILLSSLTAFALAIIKVPGSKIYLTLILAISMVPGEIFIIPVYGIMSDLGITNTLAALIIPDTLDVLGVFLMYQFFRSIPVSMIESARLDRASWFKIYYKIVMPLSKSALTTLAIITALGSWKQVLWPIIVNTNLEKMPLGPGIARLQGMFFTEYNLVMAADVLAVIPMIIIFILLQRQFIDSIANTGGK
jgi:multiple sugar transport system permease protein